MVANADASLGDDWAAIKKNAGDAYKAEHPDDSLAKLASAKTIYQNSFASAAQMHSPATHDVIMDCYAESEALYNTGVPADKKTSKTMDSMYRKICLYSWNGYDGSFNL
jgi:hypothetical protein